MSDTPTAPTPGPWLLEGTLIYTLQHYGWLKGVERFENRFTASVNALPRCCPMEEVKANARLMAAAPELLSALKEATHWLRGRGRTAEQDGAECETLHEAEEKIFAAIAKATGVQPLNNGDAK